MGDVLSSVLKVLSYMYGHQLKHALKSTVDVTKISYYCHIRVDQPKKPHVNISVIYMFHCTLI